VEPKTKQHQSSSNILSQHITSGSESKEIARYRDWVYREKELFVMCNCDRISVNSNNNDSFVTKGESKASTKSRITAVNKNYVVSADMTATFEGLREYTESHQNEVAKARRDVEKENEQLEQTQKRVENIKDKLSEEERYLTDVRKTLSVEETDLHNHKELNRQSPTPEQLKQREETQIREALARYDQELSKTTATLERNVSNDAYFRKIIPGLESNWAEKKAAYFNKVFKFVYRIKNSQMFKSELQISPTNHDLCTNFDALAVQFVKELERYDLELSSIRKS